MLYSSSPSFMTFVVNPFFLLSLKKEEKLLSGICLEDKKERRKIFRFHLV